MPAVGMAYLSSPASRVFVKAYIFEAIIQYWWSVPTPESAAFDIAKARLGNRIAFAETLGQGHGVVETKRTSAAAKEARELANEVSAML